MNKKTKIIIAIIAILIILVIPIKSVKDDGGTIVYNALTYKIIDWHEENITYESGYKTGRDIYYFPKNFRSVDYYKELADGERERNFGISRIIDNSKECAIGAEKELFYKEENIEYYFNCEKSMYIEVVFNDKTTMLLQDALLGNYIKVSSLSGYNIEYETVDTVADSMVEEIPEEPEIDFEEFEEFEE